MDQDDMEQPQYGDWLNYPDRGGFVASLDAMFPGWCGEKEIILYLPPEASLAIQRLLG